VYDTICYPTDGSKGADAVIDHARDLAGRYDATVHVLFVVDAEHVESGMAPRHDEADRQVTGMMKREAELAGEGHMSRHDDGLFAALEGRGQEVTESIAERLRESDIEAIPVVKEGEPYQVITDYAAAVDADLIAMGTHGRRGLSRHLIGSVTEKVVRTAETPVLTVRLDA